MPRKYYIYNFINKRQFSSDLLTCLVPECDIYNKPGITAHLKYRKSNYITSNPFGEYYAVFVVVCEEHELYDIEQLVLKLTKQHHPCLSEYPNNECRYGIHPEVLVGIIMDVCKSFGVQATLLRGHEITDEIENDEFYYDHEHNQKLEDKLTSHIYFKKPYDFERVCPMPELRSFQIDAIETIEQVYSDKSNQKHSMKLIIPCGTGKTVIFQEFAFRHRNDFRFIFYVTSTLKLIENMVERWEEIFPDFIIVELSSSGSRWCVDEDTLLEYLGKGMKIIFFVCDESFNSKVNVVYEYAIARNEHNKSRSLFIWDEAHKLTRTIAAGHPLDELRRPEFAYLWDDKLIFNIFCTATPVYGNFVTDNKFYMNNPEYYGADEYRFTDLEECIKANFICPMQLVLKKDSVAVANRFVSDHDTNIINCLNTLYSLLADETLKYRPNKVIIYCTLKKEVDEFYNALTLMKNEHECEILKDFKLFRLYSGIDSDKDSDGTSLYEFTNHKGKCIMINIRMLNDGINIPDIDTILFTNSIKWKPDIIQRIFRARRVLQSRPDKMAYVIIPVIVYDIKDGMYAMVLNILQELIEANDPSTIIFDHKYRQDRLAHSKSSLTESKQHIIKGLVDPEIQHNIITDINNLFMITNLNAAVSKALQLYPMTIIEVCNYVNHNRLLKFTVSFDACKSICDGMILHNKLVFDGVKYFNSEAIEFSSENEEFIKFLKQMSILQITNETDYRTYCYNQKYSESCIDPIQRFTQFGFNWSMVRPMEEKVYSLGECKMSIDKLLRDSEIMKSMLQINGYIKRIKLLREKDKYIPHQDNIKQLYGLKNMGELHKLFKERLQ